MKKCMNCHQRADKLNEKGLCEDCHDAMTPEQDFKPVYDHSLGKNNSERKVKP